MTVTASLSPRALVRPALLALLACAAGGAGAWQAKPSRPAAVTIVPPASPTTYQQTSRQQQLRDQMQKNQLEEQLRQQRADTAKRPSASNAAQQRLLDQADRAQRDRYRVRQQDAVDRYQDAVAPQAVPPPGRRADSGHDGG